MNQRINPVADLEALINEMALTQGLIQPSPIQKLLYNEEYVRGVLGINIPLNESYPYSVELQEQILQEQLLFEGFFSDFKKLKDDGKNLALAIRYMAEDGSRIKSFVKTAYETVIKEPLTKILDFIKRVVAGVGEVFKRFVLPKVQKAWDKIKEFLVSVGEKLESAWESIKGMSGWKQALTVMAFGAGIGYLWTEQGLGDIVEKAASVVDDITKAAETWGKKVAAWVTDQGAEVAGAVDLDKAAKGLSLLTKKGDEKNEAAFLPAVSLTNALYNDDVINEFFGFFGKKDSDEEAEDDVDEEEADEGFGIIADAKEAIMGYLEPLINILKDKVMGMFKGIIKKLGAEALVGMVSGGIGTFMNAIRAAFGGVKTLSNLFGDTLKGFISKIKDPEAEKEEAEKGEDDPTDDSTKKEEKKESVSREEKLIREYVREKLLAS